MSGAVDWDVVVGYADRLSARPGETLRLMVSAAGPLESEVVRLPGREPAAIPIARIADPRPQAVRTGSHVLVGADERLRPADGLTVGAWVWLAPGIRPGIRRALIATRGGAEGDGYALVIEADGRPSFEVAAGGRSARVRAGAPLAPATWTRLDGALDPGAATISLATRERGGPAERATAASEIGAPGPAPGPLMLGAEPGPDGEASAHLDGKLAAPEIRAGRPGSRRTVASWALGAGRRGEVADHGPLGLRGRCVNGPYRAVTGPDWDGSVHDWRFDDRGYTAMHFHSDATDDLGWEPTLAIEIPSDCEGGIYAVVLSCSGHEDVVPFVVRRAQGTQAAASAVLLPTFTYLAYSCERSAPALAGSTRPEDHWVAENRLLSLYDRHDDGAGAYEASLLRPLTQLRPGYRCPQHGGPHGLAQDLILLGFLARRGIAVDVLTDHDLDREGVAALAGNRTVITGAHPEYATVALLDALEAHIGAGGNLAYLGGNGLQGAISVDPVRAAVIEVRRTDSQTLCWQAAAGEHHHAASGLHGGDWRRHGRPERRLLGVGLSGFGDGPASAFERIAGPEDPAAEVIFEGLEPERPIAHHGEVLGGPAGYEVDSADPRLGTPPDTSVLAAARRLGPAYEPWPDDVVDDADRPLPDAEPVIRADMTIRGGSGGGGFVFSVGSIAWTGCLAEDDRNPVARVTENALRALEREQPFGERPGGDG